MRYFDRLRADDSEVFRSDDKQKYEQDKMIFINNFSRPGRRLQDIKEADQDLLVCIELTAGVQRNLLPFGVNACVLNQRESIFS